MCVCSERLFGQVNSEEKCLGPLSMTIFVGRSSRFDLAEAGASAYIPRRNKVSHIFDE